MINYNTTFYDSLTLREAADAYLRQLPPETDLLLSRGSSGASIAAAMLTRYFGKEGLAHCYVRKPHEAAHTTGWAGCRMRSNHAVVVDDVIDTGSTVEAILEYIKGYTGVTHIMVGQVWVESAVLAFANRWQKIIIEVDRQRVTPPLKVEHIHEEEEENEEVVIVVDDLSGQWNKIREEAKTND